MPVDSANRRIINKVRSGLYRLNLVTSQNTHASSLSVRANGSHDERSYNATINNDDEEYAARLQGDANIA